MWTLTERTTNAGIWKATSSESSNSAVSYVDGNEIEGLFCSRIYYTQASGAPYRYQITYQRLGDGEKTWSAEEIMLKPTDYSRDALSCYDPGVAQWGNYYYLGYTSTNGNNPMPIEHTLETPKNLVSANQVWLSLTIRFISTIHGTIKRSVLV